MDKKERPADPKVVKEVLGDPAFYNDQIGENQEPIKKIMEEKKGVVP